MKKPVYAVDTKVPVAQTRAEIEHTLVKFGATSFAWAWQGDRATVMFECRDRRVRFDLPLIQDSNQRAQEKDHRSRWRALFLSIKAKLVSVETGIESFEEAFLAHIVLADGTKVSDSVRPAIEQQYRTGHRVPLLGGPTP